MQMGQLHQGKDALQFFNKGLDILNAQKQKTKANEELAVINKNIASGCCAIAELFMTDLCFEPNAEQECERALLLGLKEDNTNNVQLLQTLASFRLCQKKDNEAKQLLGKVVEQLLDNAPDTYTKPLYDFRISTAKICIEIGELENAEKIVQQLLSEFDQVTDTWYLYGVIHLRRNEFNEAIKQMKKAIQVGQQTQEDEEFLKEIQDDIKHCMEELKKLGQTYVEEKEDEDVEGDDGDDDWEDEDDDDMN
jgi:tetratricopeptide (TPR) repeat protein